MTPDWVAFQRRCARRFPGFLKNAILGRQEALEGSRPDIRDAGLTERNVLEKIPLDDLRNFAQLAAQAAAVARHAHAIRDSDPVESARQWRSIFGEVFPVPSGEPNNDAKPTTYDPRPGGTKPARATTPAFA